jgi:putative endonuclease
MLDRMSHPAGHRTGAAAEELVALRLTAAGWRILGRNVRVGRGELDLVAVDPGPPAGVVVIEVRQRGRRDFGLAEETLDGRKRAALRRAVGTLRAWEALPDGTPMPHLPLRVDLVAIDPGPAGELSVRHHRGIRL